MVGFDSGRMSEKSYPMMRWNWQTIMPLCCIFGTVLLTEVVRWLDLVPVMFFVPWYAIFGAMVVLIALAAILLAAMRGRGLPLRFSTRTILLLAFVVAWPASRFMLDVRLERDRIRSQQECFETLIKLEPPALQIAASGRYNDGIADYPIQRWMIGLLASGMNPNRIPFEIASITSLDLTGSSIVDDQLSLVAKTGTVTELNLTSTKVTDAGMEELYELRALKKLTLTNTSVSKPAVEALKRKLPGLDVQQ